MNEQSFLIIHGLGGSGSDHWQSWLAAKLDQQNYHVVYPTLKNFYTPNIDVWMEELTAVIESIPASHHLTVITHSLGCLLWMHYTASNKKRSADKVILVAPPSPTVVIPDAASFFPVPIDRNSLSNAAKETLFIHSDNDHYCSLQDAEPYLKLGMQAIILPDAGHINTDAGFGKWPWIFDLCVSRTTNYVHA